MNKQKFNLRSAAMGFKQANGIWCGYGETEPIKFDGMNACELSFVHSIVCVRFSNPVDNAVGSFILIAVRGCVR